MEDRLQQKTERKTHCGSMANRRESVDGPTVGSTQERVYQQQVHKFAMKQENKVSENANSFMLEDDEKDPNAIQIKDLQIYDSLEVDAHPCSKRSPTQLHTDAMENKPVIEGKR